MHLAHICAKCQAPSITTRSQLCLKADKFTQCITKACDDLPRLAAIKQCSALCLLELTDRQTAHGNNTDENMTASCRACGAGAQHMSGYTIPEGLIQKQDPEDALISRAW